MGAPSTEDARPSAPARLLRAFALAVVATVAAVIAAPAVAAADVPDVGEPVWVGDSRGYGGTSMHAIYSDAPADPGDPGAPDFWAYCIEQPISARSGVFGRLDDFSDFLGDNFAVDPEIQAKVLWVLAHSYPALSLADFGAAAGVPGISEDDAIEAAQYAIWRYTDLDWDASWAWESADSEAAYWHLVDGANESDGMTPGDFEVAVSITGPATVQVAGALVGPFTVSTNQATVQVATDPAIVVTDAAGTVIDTSAVVDGQQLFLDLRGATAAGSATLTVWASGTSATGKVISVPTATGELTADEHAQTLILVTASTASTSAEADAEWAAVPAPSSVAPAGPETLPETGAEVPTGFVVLAALGIAAGVVLRTIARRILP